MDPRHGFGRAIVRAPARLRAHLRASVSPIGLLGGAAPLLLGTQAAVAQTAGFAGDMFNETQGVIGFSAFVALVIFSASTAILHLTGRRAWTQRESRLVADLTSSRAALDRANVFLSAESQIVVAWGRSNGEPDIEGDLSIVMDVPVPRRVLGFGSWLPPEAARNIEGCVERLRARGESFRLSTASLSGRQLEIEGRAVGGRAVMRIRDVSGDRLELARLRERHVQAMMELDSLHVMLDALPSPVWMRDKQGQISWTNVAYARAVDVADAREAITRNVELLDTEAREAARQLRGTGSIWRSRVPAVVAGQRHVLDVTDVPTRGGSAGFAADRTEIEAMRADLSRQMEANARTLDQLATAVAVFDRAKRLVFYNSAYRQLWGLDPGWLDQQPTDSEILDRLRAERKLPEQADFRSWKAALLSTYQSTETVQQIWYLPRERNLRVVVNPNAQGGVTYLFDDVTERDQLESQFNSLIGVQAETLDALKEGVAVFGSDGRLKLSNQAFADLWQYGRAELHVSPPNAAGTSPRSLHIDDIIGHCRALCPDESLWNTLRSAVAGLHDARTRSEYRVQRQDGRVLDCAAAPLPDGATLITFLDVTASIKVARALTERNEALVATQELRDNFVHHVSYELRSPLNSLSGFVELLGDGRIGPLNAKQSEYLGYIQKSSAALIAITDNILDLATIDANTLELTVSEVDIAKTIKAASEGVQDRLAEESIKLNIVAFDDIGNFQADEARVRQVLYNLLSNAIGFSSPGQSVTLAAFRRSDEIVFKVSDEGRGMPPEVLDRIFNRLENNNIGTRHRGAGLGLSIVRSFVELHGGRVQIESAPGEGTIVTCFFPARHSSSRVAKAS
ncbi:MULTISPECIES: PAS domain-containing sensor histidine kinase [unclassified Beijerinckia]|uniref:sensor histidine kinase n=1 Tax=unclassified Beijerinckia TaxID=2638183 RepID=UPI0008980226|nr:MULTISPECIES: PAS domain-containing sensor histidine kinase [unclassified Beijerinckia]MDH7797379.1 signal transduction histidine kinase [Beijerinckia sp. GAS462]SEC83243.1 Signal transduction histidine kinase [Beijerinckia sp. 28-YEA-48]